MAGDIAAVQLPGGGDGCVIVKAWPPIVNEPERAAPVLAATVKFTVADPFPAALPLIVIQSALLVAVHGQVDGAVTGTLPGPPAAGTL